MQVDYSNDFYPKIPFYMTYPMQSMYLTEMEYEKDMERMKQYYPAETKEIMELVEQRLDQLEYEGSRIYDEYDRCAVWCGNVQTALPASQMQEMDVTAEITAIVRRKR